MELLFHFIDSGTFWPCFFMSLMLANNHIVSLKKGDNFPGKVKFSDIKKLSLSEFFKRKNRKLVLFWLSLGALSILMISVAKIIIQASVQVYSVPGADLPEGLIHILAVFFVFGLTIMHLYVLPNQKELKDLRSRVAELEKTSVL